MANTIRHRTTTKKTVDYLPRAPGALISLHGRIGPGKKILGRLLTDGRMDKAWKTLTSRVTHDHEWRDLWSEIVYALRLTKLDRPELKRRQKTYKEIATVSRQLAKSIKNGGFDLLAFELFSEEVMQINGVGGWGRLEPLRRSDHAYKLLREWPSVSECLGLLEARAEQSARDVMHTIPSERTTRDRDAIVFSRRLADYFTQHFDQPLHDTVAAIAAVVLSREVTKDFVEYTYRRWKNRQRLLDRH